MARWRCKSPVQALAGGRIQIFFVLFFFWNLELQNYFREDMFSVYTNREKCLFLYFEAQGKEKQSSPSPLCPAQP